LSLNQRFPAVNRRVDVTFYNQYKSCRTVQYIITFSANWLFPFCFELIEAIGEQWLHLFHRNSQFDNLFIPSDEIMMDYEKCFRNH